MSIEILGFISDREFLKELNVKTLDFVYYSDKSEANRRVYEILRRVSRYCYACIHYNKIYYLGDENRLISEIEKLGDDIVKKYSTEPKEAVLQPTANRSHFHIARILLYAGIRQNFKKNLFRVPKMEKREEFYSYEYIMPRPDVYCHYGLKFKLDNSHEGHAILWTDMALAAWQEKKGELVGPLSYQKMKKLGLLHTFRRYSQPLPQERYKQTLRIIERIFGSGESFKVNMRTIGNIIFKRLKFT